RSVGGLDPLRDVPTAGGAVEALDSAAAGGCRLQRAGFDRERDPSPFEIGHDAGELAVPRGSLDPLAVELEDVDASGRRRPGSLLREELHEVDRSDVLASGP